MANNSTVRYKLSIVANRKNNEEKKERQKKLTKWSVNNNTCTE